MRFRDFHVQRLIAGASALLILFLSAVVAGAQSTDQNYPTPIISNEITGSIKPRDIGDPRLTTYYYALAGDQGDVFVNISIRNFSGDVDIFGEEDLRPISKVVIYADASPTVTGRVFYLRKPERMLLRIQGRPPGDAAAEFQIKFAGSFVALEKSDDRPAVAEPRAAKMPPTGIRVNSVGTILESPKPANQSRVANTRAAAVKPAERGEPPEKSEPETAEGVEAGLPKPTVVVTKVPTTEQPPSLPNSGPSTRRARRGRSVRKPSRPAQSERANPAVAPIAPAADPLASIRLTILFKDGKVIDRPMSEVFRFGVDKGVLTVVSKNGTVGRYSLTEIDKIAMQ